MNWQPIETAPKGPLILGWSTKQGWMLTRWTNDVYAENGGSGGPAGWFSGPCGDYPSFDHPTHWCELDEPHWSKPNE